MRNISKSIYNSSKRFTTKEYTAWVHMNQRCYNPNEKKYKSHGARGIKVCDHWRKSFHSFLNDIGVAPTKKHTIERVDNNGHYEPNNVRWATYKEQANNTRRTRLLEYNGEIKPMTQWCSDLNLKYSLIRDRILRGWPVDRAFSLPPFKRY